MTNPFFDHPILNSPYERPSRHWELDESGQPTQQIVESRRRTQFITPIPKPKMQKKSPKQQDFIFDEGEGLSDAGQQYDPSSIINEVRNHVDSWRALPNPAQWQVTPETARLLQHWRERELEPSDLLDDLGRAKIVITNYHTFKLRERIAKAWLDHHLTYKGGTYPAQLMYQELADMACNKITNAAGAGQ